MFFVFDEEMSCIVSLAHRSSANSTVVDIHGVKVIVYIAGSAFEQLIIPSSRVLW